MDRRAQFSSLRTSPITTWRVISASPNVAAPRPSRWSASWWPPLPARVKLTRMAHISERQRQTGPRQQLAQRKRVVIRRSVIRADHAGATGQRILATRYRARSGRIDPNHVPGGAHRRSHPVRTGGRSKSQTPSISGRTRAPPTSAERGPPGRASLPTLSGRMRVRADARSAVSPARAAVICRRECDGGVAAARAAKSPDL